MQPGPDPKTGLRFVPIPAGSFDYQGSGVSAFRILATDVTLAAYEKCVSAGACAAGHAVKGCNWGTDRKDHPINCVDWN